MNFNDYPENLKIEEQLVLNNLISRMDQVIDRLDKEAQNFVAEAKNAIISKNPDEYISLLLARKGIKDTAENRKRMIQARDELYRYRLLLQCKDSDGTELEELKVGLHSCMNGADQFVISWKMPLCRHYLLNNSSVEFENIVTDRFGEKHHTFFTLLVKNEVKLRFTRVVEAINLFPGIIDDKALTELKNSKFFSEAFLDEMIERFNPDDYNPDEAARIISDEFLQELLERRSTPEFKNIVFSIQKKQGEIIQAPYERNMVVQGCAGSGKSMIMLHRLPILLYDNPTSLSRTSLYVITPSPMYIQLAENMRYQLEISDISMGTIEQYYDYCISKYPGYNPQDYGKIDYASKISREEEQYIFSFRCIDDIKNYFNELCARFNSPLGKAYTLLKIKNPSKQDATTNDSFSKRLGGRLNEIQTIIVKNNSVLKRYYDNIKEIIGAFNKLSDTLRNRKGKTLGEIAKRISTCEDEIKTAKRNLEKLDFEANATAVKNQKTIIENKRAKIEELGLEKAAVEADGDYFESLLRINRKLESAVAPFQSIRDDREEKSLEDIYSMIDNAGALIGIYYTLSWELSKVEDKYILYLRAIKKDMEEIENQISVLQTTTDKYLDLDYYKEIRGESKALGNLNSDAVKTVYEDIMKKIGRNPDKNGKIRAIKYSPYIYLQIVYQFKGAPSSGSEESLLAIDEAQGLAPEEVRLIRNINRNHVIMNLYGDIYQHIEGTKGVDSWDDFKGIIDFDSYEMQENYRNASQITNYCNRMFGMNMNAINTPGKGVHELTSDEEFHAEVISQLLDSQRSGIGAILVGDDKEAKYLMERFVAYEQKFHDMTGEEFSIHRTRWNIMNINDAKGLEFSAVIALSGRMSRNQRYIAYTRALDDLYVYDNPVDLSNYSGNDSHKGSDKSSPESPTQTRPAQNIKVINNEVKQFFEDKGIEVIDKRTEGGRLWVIGEKENIRHIVNEAIVKFNISGKYMSSKESNNRNAWCTKTDK